MARKTAKKEEVVETAEEETARVSRSQTEKHEAFVEWYEGEYEEDLSDFGPADVIARFAAKRNEFRASDSYLKRWGKDVREAAKAKAEKASAKSGKGKGKGKSKKADVAED